MFSIYIRSSTIPLKNFCRKSARHSLAVNLNMFRKVFTYSSTRYLQLMKKSTQCSICIPISSSSSIFASRPSYAKVSCNHCRFIHSTTTLCEEKDNPVQERALVKKDFFDNVANKDKETYLDMVKIYEGRDVHRRGHVEFIYTALRHMEEFGVHKDLETYKALINVLPKGKFIPSNIFQAEFMHYPKQQQCAIDVLEQMEDNGVIPDFELEDILMNIFGKKGHPVRKFWRMMYWMPKFKNLSPWPIPNPVPNDSLELAKLAIQRISSVDLQTKVSVYEASELSDSIDATWIVSAQSPTQKELIEQHPKNVAIYVEGSYRLWLRNASVNYFILRADSKPRPSQRLEDTDDVGSLKVPYYHDDPSEETDLIRAPSVHEQDDGTILAVCATGSSSRDSLLSWIRHLEASGNPALGRIPILFTLRSSPGELESLEQIEGEEREKIGEEIK